MEGQKRQEEIPVETDKQRGEIAEPQQNTKVNIHQHFDYNSLKGRCDSFQAGNIAHSLDIWKQITSDKEVITTVMGMKIDFITEPIQHYIPNSIVNITERHAIDNEIKKLLLKRVVEPTGHTNNEIISGIFVKPKKDGSHRLILNLKQLNQYTSKLHFKMDTLNTVTKFIEKDCFMASIDLKDAYYSVRIAKTDRRYLRFYWNCKLYQFTCLPNGLSCALRKFTKLLKPPLTELHQLGHIAVAYIDDIYLQGRTHNDCLKNTLNTSSLFDSLGFIIHPDKSVFSPSQHVVFLGFVLNSVNMTVSLTTERALDVITLCKILLEKTRPTIRETACVIGKIISTFPGVMYGPLYYRSLEADKTSSLKQNKGKFDKCMTLSTSAKSELDWWIANLSGSYNLMT